MSHNCRGYLQRHQTRTLGNTGLGCLALKAGRPWYKAFIFGSKNKVGNGNPGFTSAEHSQTVSSAIAQDGRWQVQEGTKERIGAKLGKLALRKNHLLTPSVSGVDRSLSGRLEARRKSLWTCPTWLIRQPDPWNHSGHTDKPCNSKGCRLLVVGCRNAILTKSHNLVLPPITCPCLLVNLFQRVSQPVGLYFFLSPQFLNPKVVIAESIPGPADGVCISLREDPLQQSLTLSPRPLVWNTPFLRAHNTCLLGLVHSSVSSTGLQAKHGREDAGFIPYPSARQRLNPSLGGRN